MISIQIQKRLKMINIVIPMAGRGSRFANMGFTMPKPLIPIHSLPMIEVVVNNIGTLTI